MKKLYKSRDDVKIDGVCAGVAKYFGIDVTLVRILWLVLTFSGGAGLWAYIICAFLMPREPYVEPYTETYAENREN